MNDIIELLAKLDWFEYIGTFVRWLSGIQSWKITIDRNCGVSGQQIEDLLTQHGIKVWGRGFTRNTLTFRVKEQQANWAEYLLHQNNVPVLCRPFNPKNAHHEQTHGGIK